VRWVYKFLKLGARPSQKNLLRQTSTLGQHFRDHPILYIVALLGELSNLPSHQCIPAHPRTTIVRQTLEILRVQLREQSPARTEKHV
jgi:hypothetical protein